LGDYGCLPGRSIGGVSLTVVLLGYVYTFHTHTLRGLHILPRTHIYDLTLLHTRYTRVTHIHTFYGLLVALPTHVPVTFTLQRFLTERYVVLLLNSSYVRYRTLHTHTQFLHLHTFGRYFGFPTLHTPWFLNRFPTGPDVPIGFCETHPWLYVPTRLHYHTFYRLDSAGWVPLRSYTHSYRRLPHSGYLGWFQITGWLGHYTQTLPHLRFTFWITDLRYTFILIHTVGGRFTIPGFRFPSPHYHTGLDLHI